MQLPYDAIGITTSNSNCIRDFLFLTVRSVIWTIQFKINNWDLKKRNAFTTVILFLFYYYKEGKSREEKKLQGIILEVTNPFSSALIMCLIKIIWAVPKKTTFYSNIQKRNASRQEWLTTTPALPNPPPTFYKFDQLEAFHE
jgi:hypothetical protein